MLYYGLWFICAVVSLRFVNLDAHVGDNLEWVLDYTPFYIRLIVGAFIALACIVFLDMCLAGPSAIRRIVGDRYAPHTSYGQTSRKTSRGFPSAARWLTCASMVCVLAVADRGSYTYFDGRKNRVASADTSSILQLLFFEIPLMVAVTLLCTWIIRKSHDGLRSRDDL